jgi:hypothetical protein
MIAESLRLLLAKVVDYAGLYPPASLPLNEVIENYQRYLGSSDAWMLNRLVLPADKLHDVTLGEQWRVTLLVEGEPGPLPRQVETLETRSGKRLSLPTYCEVPLDQVVDGYAKIRTSTPSSEAVTEFLCAAAARRLPFKATAGLHHPIRARLHGFLNVFIAATFAWSQANAEVVNRILNETDAQAFQFHDDGLQWKDWSATLLEIRQARRDFAHSFGSCSFEEPVNDLRDLGLLK